MASIRTRIRRDGTPTWNVMFVIKGRQTSVTFTDEAAAEKFREAVNLLGPERAMTAWGITDTAVRATSKAAGPTVTDWVREYIASRSGVTKSTLYDYNAYLTNDIAPALGKIPVEMLNRADIARWVDDMAKAGSSGKTIANKHGLLSAALSAAVAAKLIDANPAAGTRLPRTERPEMVFLTADEFQHLRAGFLPHWHPLLDFMVASGARFGEIAALRPSDVDRKRGTVYIGRAWKRTYEKDATYEIGVPKTQRSTRTISVDKSVLDALDYSGEYLFTNTKGGPLKVVGWRTNVWYKSVKRAQDKHGLKKAPRIHDMRHTCASWMLTGGIPITTVSRHLGHESITTTGNLYSHFDRKDADVAAALMGAALRPGDVSDIPPRS